MTQYRVFFVDRDGKISRPAKVIQADSDVEAKQKASLLVDGLDIEVWDEARLIAKFPRSKSGP